MNQLVENPKVEKFSTKFGRCEQHPLFNQLILERIFEYLRVQHLKSARLTCKFWTRIASPYLQSKSEVVLKRGNELDKRKFSFRNFLLYIEHVPCNEIFFRNYHIEHWILNERRERNMFKFWEKCGKSMTELYLKDIIFYESKTLRNVLYYWTPNLETLTIEDCLFYTITSENIPANCDAYSEAEDFDQESVYFDYYDHVTAVQLKNIERNHQVPVNTKVWKLVYDQLEEEVFPLSWQEIFTAFPNITHLKIAASTPASQTTEILKAIIAIRESQPHAMSLKSLSFFQTSKGLCELLNSHFDLASNLDLVLDTLELQMSKATNQDSILNFLGKQNMFLKHLHIHRETDANDEERIDIFTNLEFPLLKYFHTSLSLVGNSFEFLKSMPSLQELRIWFSFDDFSWEVPLQSIANTTELAPQNNLEIFSCGYDLESPDCICKIAVWFPCLKKIEMSMNDSLIREIFRLLPNLEEITVFDRYLSDDGITGTPHSPSESDPYCGRQRQHPYIGDLKKLRKFELRYWKYENITDISVYHGFMDIKELTHLILTKTKISETALRELSHKSNLQTLSTPTVVKGDAQ